MEVRHSYTGHHCGHQRVGVLLAACRNAGKCHVRQVLHAKPVWAPVCRSVARRMSHRGHLCPSMYGRKFRHSYTRHHCWHQRVAVLWHRENEYKWNDADPDGVQKETLPKNYTSVDPKYFLSSSITIYVRAAHCRKVYRTWKSRWL